ncbi:hypothetical protein BJ912DRAFT_590382 [Pholiota molesta]|nr:hypothetical protein BJ912DRAFT_590382 [Pholiota molesta]
MRMFTICTLGAIATTHTALNTRMAGLVCVSETKAVRNRHPGPLCCQGRSAAVGCPSQMLTPRFPPARAHGPRLMMPANVFNYKFLPSSIETALTSMTISICLTLLQFNRCSLFCISGRALGARTYLSFV